MVKKGQLRVVVRMVKTGSLGWLLGWLRAPDQKNRESDDRSEISYFILFHQKFPFGKLFSKIIINTASAFWFSQKLEKIKIRLDAP